MHMENKKNQKEDSTPIIGEHKNEMMVYIDNLYAKSKATEVFQSSAVRSVEIQILYTLQKNECRKDDDYIRGVIAPMLMVRKHILDNMFVMDDEYKQLLFDFNESLKMALLEMRQQTIGLHQHALQTGLPNIETTGRLFLGLSYPKIHPVQTNRARKIWELLSGAYDHFMPLYKDGVSLLRLSNAEYVPSENYVLYMGEQEDNWNEGLNPMMTDDMHLCYGVHNLTDHNAFSWFDLLWVRDFYTEITTESSHSSNPEDCGDDLNWDSCDYYD